MEYTVKYTVECIHNSGVYSLYIQKRHSHGRKNIRGDIYMEGYIHSGDINMERTYTWRKYVQYMMGCIHENDVPMEETYTRRG